jgi:hypothetical protein
VNRSGFEVVVDFARVEIAERQFGAWLSARGRSRDDLAPDDVIVDVGRSSDGDVRRYSVRLAAL